MIGGSGTVIIGDSHTPAPFIPPLPLLLKKTYGHAFSIVDSETDQPLAGRNFTATVDGQKITGVTDSEGIASVKTSSKDATISISIDFISPARLNHPPLSLSMIEPRPEKRSSGFSEKTNANS